MTRARELARLANENVLSVEDDSLEVGINSTKPTSALDVAGQFNVGTAIKAGVAGVITATEFSGSIGTFSGAGSFGGNLDVTGNVTIGGTLTYEDVTNIDSVGIVTARAGVNVSGGQLLVGSGVTIGNAGVATFSGTSDIHLLDNVRLNVGDGSDLTLYHDGSNSYIKDTGTGFIAVQGSEVFLRSSSDEKFIHGVENDRVDIYFNNSKKWETTNDGTVTTGIATATGLDVADKITHTGDANTAIRFPAADTVTVETGGSERVRIESGGDVGINTDNPTVKLDISEDGVAFPSPAGSTLLRLRNSGGTATISIDSAANANSVIQFGDTAAASVGTIQYSHTTNHLQFNTNGDGEKMRITSAGRVGIGTDSPDSLLHILAGNDRSAITIANTYPTPDNVWELNPGISGVTNTGFCIRDITDSANRLVIDGSGLIGFGTNSPSSYNSKAYHFVISSSSHTGMTIVADPSSDSSIYFSDGTSGAAQYAGWVQYEHDNNAITFGANAGERARINQYGMMGLSVTSPDALLSVLAQNSNTPPFVIQNPDNDENFTIATYHDGNGIYGTIGANYKLNSGGTAVVDTTDHRTAGILFDGRNNGAIMFETNSAGNQPDTRLKITQRGGFTFNNAELVERVNITAGKLSANVNIPLSDGMVHYFTTQETTTCTPNIRIDSSNALNDAMDTADVVTVTLITTAAAAGYHTNITIDGNAVTEEWVGGSAPSEGGSDGLDVYTYTIIKTGNNAYTVLANLTNCSN